MVEMDPKVGMMILGAQKCSTTTVFHLLKNHPQMCASKVKETNFFITASDWRKEISQYANIFAPQPGQLLFEASTAYTFYPLRRLQIWEDMYDYNPDLKFIYLVRNPIERIVSAYMHTYLRGYSNLDIHGALKNDCSLLIVSRYYTQIIPFIRQFGRDKVLIIDVEDLHQDRKSTLMGIAEFLDIQAEPFLIQSELHKNRSLDNRMTHHKWDNPDGMYRWIQKQFPKVYRRLAKANRRQLKSRPELTVSEKRMIIDVLDQEIENLEKLTGKSLQHWREIEDREVPRLQN